MVVAGPQRGLFLACLIVGLGNVLALDLLFAPAALSAEHSPPPAAPATSSAHVPVAADAAPAIAARVVIPAPARVPTIVARFDSASKEPSDQSAIRALATAMIEEHDVAIVLEGHSDTRGGDDYNHTISLDRANWVKARLVELGVSDDRIETVGLGATRPLRSDEPDSPSINRRVEVRWLGSGPREAPPPRPPVKSPVAPREVPAARPSPSADAITPLARPFTPDASADAVESAPRETSPTPPTPPPPIPDGEQLQPGEN
jgi:outer membrane protein OmpA-like peptidoglycan-associated protein